MDTVLYFEGEVTLDYRLLRTTKNRFGSVDELGVFSMTEQRTGRGAQSVGGVPRRARRRHQRQRGHGADGRDPAGAGRGPGARRQVGVRHAAAGGHRARPQAARGAARRAGAAGRDLVRRSRRLRPGHRRRPAHRARRRSRGGRGAAQQPVQPARAGRRHLPRRDRAGRRDPAQRRHRAPDRRGGPARVPPGVRLLPRHRRRWPASRWSASTTSSSWCARLPRDVGRRRRGRGAGHPGRRRRCPSSTSRSPACRCCFGRSGPSSAIPTSAQVVVVLPPADAERPPEFLAGADGRGAGRRRRRARSARDSVAAGLARARRRVHGRAGARRRPAVRGPRVIDAVIAPRPARARARSRRCR